MNGIAVLTYIGIGFAAGMIVGIGVGVSGCCGHPIVLSMWEDYRKAREARRGVKQALRNLNAAIAKGKPQ